MNAEGRMVGSRLMRVYWIGVAFWGVIYTLISPEFSDTDIFIFKDPGVNWALGRGFVGSLIPGNPSLEPRFFSSYPPLFPFLFGLYTKIAGVGAYQNTFFNFGLACISGFLFLLLLLKFSGAQARSVWISLSVFVTVFLLPRSLLGITGDRPEPLSFLILMASLLTMQSRVKLAFFLAGLNAVSSPFGGGLNLILLLFLRCTGRWREGLTQLPQFLALFLAPAISVLCIYQLADPESLGRLFEHGTAQGGLRIILGLILRGDFRAFADAIRHGAFSSGLSSVGLFFPPMSITAVSAIYYFRRYRMEGSRQWLEYGFFSLGVGIFPYIFFPLQNNYMALCGGVLLVLFIHSGMLGERNGSGWSLGIFGICALLFIFQLPMLIRTLAIRSTNRPSYSRAFAQALQLKEKMGGRDFIGAVHPSLYFIYKPYFKISDSQRFYREEEIRKIGVVAMTYCNSGDSMKPVMPHWFSVTPGFRLDSSPSLPQETRMFGIRFSKSSNTWESAVYFSLKFPRVQ